MSQLTRRHAVSAMVAAIVTGTQSRADGHAAGPPLWVAAHGSAKVYFFGQLAVRADSVWLSGAARQAFDDSSELWTENPEPPAGAPPALPVAPGPKLADVATPQEMTRLRAMLVREGLASAALDSALLADAYPAVSWLQDHALGVDYSAIPERELRVKAKAAGKSVHSEWASFEDVARFASELPANVRTEMGLELFRRALDEAEHISQVRLRLAQWQEGKLSALNAMADRNRRFYPLLDKLVGADRNHAWIARTATIMQRAPCAFVCVGIGHLLGPTSIQTYLLESGVAVRRV